MAMLQLLIHILFDEVHWYMTRTFNNHLNIIFPRYLSQLTQRTQFRELGFIVGIGNRARTQTISQ